MTHNNQRIEIDECDYSIETIGRFLNTKNLDVVLSNFSKDKIEACYKYLHTKIESSEKSYYGINTGFGQLCNVTIPDQELSDLQYNLIRSHACGAGDAIPCDIVRMMMLTKIISLSKGHSGVKLETVNLLIELLRHEITPVVYEQGSLGASGDLAPLAHIGLVLLGEGEVHFKGDKVDTQSAFAATGLQPIHPEAKEGLAILNGTQFMLAYGIYVCYKSQKLLKLSSQISALSAIAFSADKQPFSAKIHAIRPHSGQVYVAREIYSLLDGIPLIQYSVQDPYSFRCIPQVHGASADVVDHVSQIVERELNSVTDNPNIFPQEDEILNGGNFHGQPLAMAFDYMSIALAEMGSISERRVFQLLSGTRGLPPFLADKPGVESGMMIVQYTAASIVSLNKQLCSPNSVDSIPSSNGQEDHVSMGANGAVQMKSVFDNVTTLLAIELLVAAKALTFRTTQNLPTPLQELLSSVYLSVNGLEGDQVWSNKITKCKSVIESLLV